MLPLIKTIRLTTTYEPMMPLVIEEASPARTDVIKNGNSSISGPSFLLEDGKALEQNDRTPAMEKME
jgi:hypothetical protein